MPEGDEEVLNGGGEAFKGSGQASKVNLKALIGDVEALMGNRKALKGDGETLTHSRRHFQYIQVSVDGTFFKCLLFMTSYNTSYLGLRPVPSK